MKSYFTMDDVYRDWDSKIAKTILGAGIAYDDVEDVKSDIYVSMVRRNICEKYDPSRAKCFSTYMYRVIHSLIGNHFRDKKRQRRIPESALAHINYMHEDDTSLFADALRVYALQTEDEAEATDFIERILKELDCPKNYRVVRGKNGTSLTHKEIVKRVFDGYSLKDIAESIGVRTEKIKESLKSLKRVKQITECLTSPVRI